MNVNHRVKREYQTTVQRSNTPETNTNTGPENNINTTEGNVVSRRQTFPPQPPPPPLPPGSPRYQKNLHLHASPLPHTLFEPLRKVVVVVVVWVWVSLVMNTFLIMMRPRHSYKTTSFRHYISLLTCSHSLFASYIVYI